MTSRILEALRADLAEWRTRADELRVQANLGKMEARERLEEAQKAFEKAHSSAVRKLAELRDDSEQELAAVKKSVSAGWDELRRTYVELTKRKG